MPSRSSERRTTGFAAIAIVLLLIVSAIGVIVSTANDLGLEEASLVSGLNDNESAYYEYVAPRLDRLVVEVDAVAELVDAKSRDILALTISGARIEELTDEVTEFGETNGVPDRFSNIHRMILDATGTATFTFDQARQALRSFDFSNMSSLVTDFQDAAESLREAQEELRSLTGGTDDAS